MLLTVVQEFSGAGDAPSLQRRGSGRGFLRVAMLATALVSVSGCIATTPSTTSASSAPVFASPASSSSAPSAPQSSPTAQSSPAASRSLTLPRGAMPLDRFWALIEGTPAENPDVQAAALKTRLAALSPADLRAYELTFIGLANALTTDEHLGAAEVIMGAVSDDVFVSFRTWVVYRGRAVYEGFLREPDSLAAVGPSDDEQIGRAETLEFLPEQLGAEIGEDGPSLYGVDLAPPKIDHSYASLAQRYPRLAAVYLPIPLPVGDVFSNGPRPISRRA